MTTNDYIGLSHPSDPNGSSLNWLYVSCSQQPAPAAVPSGSCTFRMPLVTQPTAFQFRYFSNGTLSNPPIATPNTVTVNPRPTPAITSVQFSGAGQALQITINGAGFDNPPMNVPYTGDTSFFLFSDVTKNWNAGGDTDTVTLSYASWSDTKIQINGFAGSYGPGSEVLDAADTVRISFPNAPVGPTSTWQGLTVNGPLCALLSGAVPANQGPPACPNGVDSATAVTSGQRLTITASGYAAYGNDITASCSGVLWTDPSGNRYSSASGGASCGAPKIDPGSVAPASPVGELLGRIGTSGAWFAVGTGYTGTAATGDELYLLYNDSPGGYGDNAGQYAVTISVAPLTGSSYHAVTPTRIFDSRLAANGPAIGPGQVRCFPVAGVGVVPGSATAVVLNVAVTDTTSASYLTVFPSGQNPPNAANLNWVPGMTVPNLIIVKVGPDGQVCVTSPYGTLNLVVDLQGYLAPPAQSDNAGRFQPLAPNRIYDTRFGPGSLGPQETRTLKVAGLGGLPQSGMSAVVMNVSVTNPTSAGFLTVFPGGIGWPGSSNLNWSAGETVPNRVIVPVGSNGQISLYNAVGRVDVILDVNGWFTDSSGTGGGSLFYPLAPARIFDSRFSPWTPAIAQQQTRLIAAAGQGGVPSSGATALVANIAVTDTSDASFLAAFPGGTSWPGSSDLNWTAGKTVPNLIVTQLGNGGINVYNAIGTTDVVVDVAGYFQ